MIALLTSLAMPAFISGWLLDSDTEDDSLPWYVSAAISVVLILTGVVLSLVVLTRFGFFEFLLGVLRTYFGFAQGVIEAVAAPVTKVLL